MVVVMTAWWHGIWNDPINSNPWAFGMLIVIVALIFAAFHAWMVVKSMFRRRKQETKMTDPASPDPISTDRAAATEVIAAATERPRETSEDLSEWDNALSKSGQPWPPADATPAPESWATGLPEARDIGETTWGRDDSEPQPVTHDQPPAAGWTAAPEPGRRLLAAPRMTARAAVPAPIVSAERADCPHCGGTGYVPSISDYLRESIALVGDAGDDVIRQFYATLLRAAPDLASLFPSDLLGTDETHGQRDRLLKALVALSNLYDPASPDKMAQLDTALASFGRSHAAFARPDGTVQGATWEEYGAVKTALFGTLVTAAGAAWKPEYTAAWSQAYDYAAGVMLVEQYRSGFSSPRFPRA